MLAHSFDRFYVVTKLILPSVSDLKFLPIDFNEKCNYLNDDIICDHNSKEYISNLKVYCKKIVPFVHFHKEQISSYSYKGHDILTNELSLILLTFPKDREEKRSVIALLITGFIGLVYGIISSYFHSKRQKALHKAFISMENKINLQCNKIIHLEDSIVMHGIYNLKTLVKLITTVHKMHKSMTPNEKLFAGKLSSWYTWYLTKDGIGHNAINSLLYLRMLREKYVKMYEEFINQLCVYAKLISILWKGYLPISLLPPLKLQEILGKLKRLFGL